MGVTTKTLYDTDFVEWTAQTAELLRAGRLDQADLEHAAEEIADLGKRERSAVASQLHRMLMHLIMQRIQPERDGKSWRRSITEGRAEISYRLDDSPSLRRYAQDTLQKIYERAVRDALFETGLAERRWELNLPAQCPYELKALLEADHEF
jgi:uncharacterized protein YaaN involved in tellurite resistance